MIASHFSPARFRLIIGLAVSLLVTTSATWGQDLSATATFVPAQLAIAQNGEFDVTVTGAATTPKGDIPNVNGLEMQYIGASSSTRIANGEVSSDYTFHIRVRATQKGTYTVPAFDVTVKGKTVTVPSASVEVTDRPAPASATPGSTDLVTLTATLPRTDIYVGERIPLDVTVAWQPNLHPQSTGEFNQSSDAFQRVELIGHPDDSSENLNGRTYATNTWHTMLIPLKSGPQKLNFTMPLEVMLPNQGMSGMNDPLIQQLLGPNSPFGMGQQQSVNVESPALDLNVQPLPTEGRPANFTGGIGTFSIDEPSLSATDLQVGVPVTLTLTVSGQGNFDRLHAPALDTGTAWHTYPPKDTFKAQDATSYHGVKTFEYVIVPQSENITMLPAPMFNFFNPETKSYVELPLKDISVTVKPAPPGQAMLPLPTVASASTNNGKLAIVGPHIDSGAWQNPNPRVILTSPYFWAGQAVPAILFGALVITRRRKLRLENDPAFARRLQARHEAHAAVSQAHVAAAAGRATEFYAVAQRALQEAASHDRQNAAEALTWEEFDSHLAARGTSAEIRQKAREIFDAGDALRFGGFSPDKASLTATSKQLEQLVQKLLGNA